MLLLEVSLDKVGRRMVMMILRTPEGQAEQGFWARNITFSFPREILWMQQNLIFSQILRSLPWQSAHCGRSDRHFLHLSQLIWLQSHLI